MTVDLRERLAVYVIVSGTTPESIVEHVLAAGVGSIQYREKHLPLGQQLRQARRLRELCRRAGALFFVNDRLDLAMAAGADGVHLGQSDLPPSEARRLWGPQALIGASCANLEELPFSEGADYVGVGPIYATASKDDAGAPRGVESLSRVCQAFPGPVVGIGGIGPGRVAPLIHAGACGVSVISAVLDAPDPAAAARELLREVKHALAEPGAT
jgi:thiamine-phosphate diphosphorylase